MKCLKKKKKQHRKLSKLGLKCCILERLSLCKQRLGKADRKNMKGKTFKNDCFAMCRGRTEILDVAISESHWRHIQWGLNVSLFFQAFRFVCLCEFKGQRGFGQRWDCVRFSVSVHDSVLWTMTLNRGAQVTRLSGRKRPHSSHCLDLVLLIW